MKQANNLVSYSLRGQAMAPKMVPLMQDAFRDNGNTTIYWLSGAGWLLNSHGINIMIDPVIAYKPLGEGIHTVSELDFPLFQELPIDAENVSSIDAVLFTHADGDHQGQMTVKILNRNTNVKFYGTAPVLSRLKNMQVDNSRQMPVEVGKEFNVGELTILPTKADHRWQNMNIEFYGEPYLVEDCCGYYISTEDGTFWVTGDTIFCPEHLNLPFVDVMALDISEGKKFWHMGHEDTVKLANFYKDTILIPHHWGTYDEPYHPYFSTDPLDFMDEIEDAENRLCILGPGQGYEFHFKKN